MYNAKGAGSPLRPSYKKTGRKLRPVFIFINYQTRSAGSLLAHSSCHICF
jgi:hypothetical protein